jgi:hypothetical protein
MKVPGKKKEPQENDSSDTGSISSQSGDDILCGFCLIA